MYFYIILTISNIIFFSLGRYSVKESSVKEVFKNAGNILKEREPVTFHNLSKNAEVRQIIDDITE